MKVPGSIPGWPTNFNPCIARVFCLPFFRERTRETLLLRLSEYAVAGAVREHVRDASEGMIYLRPLLEKGRQLIKRFN